MSSLDRLSEFVEPEPEPSTPAARAARLRLSLQMANAGITMMRLNLRRHYQDASDAEVEERLSKWLDDRPLAGDTCMRLAPQRFPNL